MSIPANLVYTKDHEWAQCANGMATIGITDYAQHSLGDITFVELPKVGTKVKKSEQFAVVESVKAASDVYAPVSGEVVTINEALAASPERINTSPYDEGWFVVVRMSDEKEVSGLLNSAAYQKYIEGLH
ncbi:MAG TPA: glycine cleavage system protein GcvH [Candidatus Omnitrophota bacterium]|nr:glycine cleavage system protein GcvH [Candidatus Omnitrophota bacterium]